jgi:hypothetical protein
MILKLHVSGRLIAFTTPNNKFGRFGNGARYCAAKNHENLILAHALCGPFSRNRKTRAEALRKP